MNIVLKVLHPSPSILWGFGRSGESIRPAFELLKSGSMPKSKSVTGQLLNSLLGDGSQVVFVIKKLMEARYPILNSFEKYFGTTGFVME